VRQGGHVDALEALAEELCTDAELPVLAAIGEVATLGNAD
jgi:hypothetical protein